MTKKKKKIPVVGIVFGAGGIIACILGLIYLMRYLQYSGAVQEVTGDFWAGMGGILGFTALGPTLLAYGIICLVVGVACLIVSYILFRRRI